MDFLWDGITRDCDGPAPAFFDCNRLADAGFRPGAAGPAIDMARSYGLCLSEAIILW
jgi:hypothetical protein